MTPPSPPLPLQSCNSSMFLKENPYTKKNIALFYNRKLSQKKKKEKKKKERIKEKEKKFKKF